MNRFWREADWIAPLALTGAALLWGNALEAAAWGFASGWFIRRRFCSRDRAAFR